MRVNGFQRFSKVFSAREECNDGEVGIAGVDSAARQRCGETKAKGEGGVVRGRGCAWRGSVLGFQPQATHNGQTRHRSSFLSRYDDEALRSFPLSLLAHDCIWYT